MIFIIKGFQAIVSIFILGSPKFRPEDISAETLPEITIKMKTIVRKTLMIDR